MTNVLPFDRQATIAAQISELRASRPYDGRRVTLRETRGGWRWTGISGICTRIAADHRYMVILVEHDPDDYWPVGGEILAELDDETVPMFAYPVDAQRPASIQGDTMTIDDIARVRFTNRCCPNNISYNDPDHPRHTFPEDWDSASHPRFDLVRIQRGFEDLLAKGYTVSIELGVLRVLNTQGQPIFEMELPRHVG